jgi:mannosyltransferase
VVLTCAALAWRERGDHAVQRVGGVVQRADGLLLCTVTAVLPPFLLWLASHGEISYFRYQYAMFTVPAWAVLAGAGLAHATRRPWTPVAALAVLALLLLPDQARVRQEYEHDVLLKADYVGAARTIAKYYRPGDAMVLVRGAPWMLDEGVRAYLPPRLRLREVFVDKTAAENHELFPTQCARPAHCLGTPERIWLVVAGDPADPLSAAPPDQAALLRARYKAFGTERLSGLTVELLLRTSKTA